jgi:hypothetical protein
MDSNTVALSQKLDGIGWALLFIWTGLALLLNVSWGWGLVGVGVIILGAAAVRAFMKMTIDGFSVAIGIAFLAGGAWKVFQVSWPFVPILIIACGLAALWGAVRRQHLQGH